MLSECCHSTPEDPQHSVGNWTCDGDMRDDWEGKERGNVVTLTRLLLGRMRCSSLLGTVRTARSRDVTLSATGDG